MLRLSKALKNLKKLFKMEYKQVVVVRQDLKLPKGKLGAQAAHAAVESVLISLKKNKETVESWRRQGQKKVILKVEDEKDLYKYVQAAKDSGIITAVITDAGKTVIAPGTVTCAGIGPASEDEIDSITGNLKML